MALLGLSSDGAECLDRLELDAGHRWQGSNATNGIRLDLTSPDWGGLGSGVRSGVWGTDRQAVAYKMAPAVSLCMVDLISH